MKPTRAAVVSKAHARPELRFQDQALTSFAGLVLLQALFARLDLLDRLRGCFRHLKVHPIFGHARIVLLLVVHLFLGFRRLRDIAYYHDDPMVRRVLGLRVLPNVSTISRTLASADPASASRLRGLIRALVLQRLAGWGARRLTIDLDGAVLSTNRAAEGSAVGFNRKKKGARSYYPLFCTVAQTGQVFDFLHRPGNVHDSRGALEFLWQALLRLRAALPAAKLEVRMDAAFFSHAFVRMLDEAGVDFTISAPFEHFPDLKARIQDRRRWKRLSEEFSYFEAPWAPKVWDRHFRFVFVRHRVRRQRKGPLQLDLFIPIEHDYEYQVIVTNKTTTARNVVAFHHGRGAQEAIFGELKSQCQADYVPVRTWVGNQLYLAAAVLAHNLGRELQMVSAPPQRTLNEKRSPLWAFAGVETLRRRLVQRAGRLTYPQGRLTLTMNANEALRDELLARLRALDAEEVGSVMQR